MFTSPASRQQRRRAYSYPGGSTTQVQYNNSGAFAGDANLTWTTGASATLTVGNSTVNTAINTFGIDTGNTTVNTSVNSTLVTIGTVGTTIGVSIANNLLTIGNSSVNSTVNSVSHLIGAINSTAVGVSIANNLLTIGNSSVNATINSTVYTGSANYLGSVPASSVVTRSFDILVPASADTYTLWHTKDAITISEIVLLIGNTLAGAWANLTFYSGTTRPTVVQTILNSNTANNTTGVSTTSMNFANVAANSWIWCNVTAMGVNTAEIHGTLRFSA